MFSPAAQEFVARPWGLIHFDALRAIAFDLALDPEEHFGPQGLWAGVTAPQPAGQGGEEEESHRGQNQQDGGIDEILRVERHPQDMEPACRQIPEDDLAIAPRYPAQGVERAEDHDEGGAPQSLIGAGHLAGMDLLARSVKRAAFICLGRRCRFSGGGGIHGISRFESSGAVPSALGPAGVLSRM